MCEICLNDERFVEEDFLGLPESDAVEIPVLVDIPLVPLEAGTPLERVPLRHERSIYGIYTFLYRRKIAFRAVLEIYRKLEAAFRIMAAVP